MTDPPRPLCQAANPRQMCGERRAALRLGEMFYSVFHAGWLYPAEDRHVPHGLTREGKAPFVWRFCPFCGEPLPDAFDQIAKLLDDSGDGTE